MAKAGSPQIDHQATSTALNAFQYAFPFGLSPSFLGRSYERRALNILFTTKVVIPMFPQGLSMHLSLLFRTLVWTHLGPVTIAHMF